MAQERKIIMIGHTGAVGSQVSRALARHPDVRQLTLLGRRTQQRFTEEIVTQEIVDLMDPPSYQTHLSGHDTAICTLGIGEPSKVSKETFVRVDKTAVIDFATACKKAGVSHFELLGSVATSPTSPLFYLRTKGELIDELKALSFERLSIFQPSMILTPENRYGFSQALTLTFWPWLHPFLMGPLRKYRGVKVARLGQAMANHAFTDGSGHEVLEWDAFASLAKP